MHKRNVFYGNTVTLYLMTIANYVFPLLTFPYLTRVLHPDMYGVLIFMMATVSYFQIFIDFGFNLSATKEIAEHSEDKNYIGQVLSSVIQSKLILVVVAVVTYSLLVWPTPILRQNAMLAYLYLGTVIVSVWLPDYLFLGLEKMKIITIRFLISKLVTTALIFFLVRKPHDIFWIPILSIIGYLTSIAFTWYYINRTLGIKLKSTGIRMVIQKVKESTVYFASTFATTAFSATTTLMLGIVSLPATQIAFWGVSYNLIASAQSFYVPITNSLYPHMVARKDFALVKKILLVCVPVITMGCLGVFLLAKLTLIVISGTEYEDAVPIFRALLPVLIFSFPAQVLGFPVLGVISKVKNTTLTTVISGSFHICGLLLLLFIGRFSLLNVAILRSFTEAVLLASRCFILIRIRRLIETRKRLDAISLRVSE